MNKTILITGASSGIGKETAKLFQVKGWNVVATMRQPEAGAELAAQSNVLVLPLDVLNVASIDAAVAGAIAEFGSIDVLVNNAGYGAIGPLEAFSREQIVRQFNTNVIGLLDVTKAVLPHFRKQQSGIIINISSIGGRMAFPIGSLYHGTKFAVEGISESLSYEVAGFGGKVKIVEPGGVETDFLTRSMDFNNDESIAEYQPTVNSLLAALPAFFEHRSPASLIAGVIYEAATDGSNKLRYTAGEDANTLIAGRTELGDEAFMEGIRKQFGL